MFTKIKELFSNHSGKLNIASYTALIIAGVTGYSNLMQEHGKLQATVQYQTQETQELKSDIDRMTEVYSALNKQYNELVLTCTIRKTK